MDKWHILTSAIGLFIGSVVAQRFMFNHSWGYGAAVGILAAVLYISVYGWVRILKRRKKG